MLTNGNPQTANRLKATRQATLLFAQLQHFLAYQPFFSLHEPKPCTILHANKKWYVSQGWQYGTVRLEFAYYVSRTLNRTVLQFNF